MKKVLTLVLFILILFQMINCHKASMIDLPLQDKQISIIPKPMKIEKLSGTFFITPETKIMVYSGDQQIKHIAEYFRDRFKKVAGFDLFISNDLKNDQSNRIIFKLSKNQNLGEEGYQLTVKNNHISLQANKPQALFYGIQTIFQLLPAEIYSDKKVGNITWSIPCVEIVDKPRYSWRGMMLDVSRHFFSKEFVKEFIDYLAMHKMNRFHWHLNDDQGWRIEIKKYPKLTDISAWRVDREDQHWNAREPQLPGEKATYGGFYTQEDIREIVDYAKSQFITIIPEIEMPGHCTAVLAAYPQYSCAGGPFTVLPGGVWPIKDVYCPGNEEVFGFLQNILSEVIELFPSEFIHIGGDEVNKQEWEKCEKCQRRMNDEGLKTEEELQSYFIKRMEKFLSKNGKRLIGWDEILEGGLAPNATVMSWRGIKGGIEAAKNGHDIVMSPTSHCYFDYYQGEPEYEPLAIGGFLPLKKVYSFEPTPEELTDREAKHILGVQANLWTEYIRTPEHTQYMTFPRITAVAEVGWIQKGQKDWEDFTQRMQKQFRRYEKANINYAKSAYAVRVFPTFEVSKKQLLAKLETETSLPMIFYTLDGSEPTINSEKYSKPIQIKETCTLKAGTFLNDKLIDRITETKFFAHKAMGKPVKLKYPFKERYNAGGEIALTNGLRGSKSHTDGLWQGFEGDNFVAIIDLGSVEKINKITAGFLQRTGSWIFMPEFVEFLVSDDGIKFTKIAKVVNDVSLKNVEVIKKDFSTELTNTNTRYIQVFAKNIKTCPDWHAGAGGLAWIFVDEIIVE